MIPIRFKSLIIIFILSLTGIVLSACTNTDNTMEIQSAQNPLSDYINQQEDEHDFLNDDDFISIIDDLIEKITKYENLDKKHMAIGHLTDDNLPEIVYFREKNQDDIKDSGYLEVYGFKEQGYELIDKMSMNFDNSNYQLVIGNVAQDLKGIYLNNQAGSHSGVTYGFILEDGKLKNILNPKKVNLISVDTKNEIRDYDNNGILNFSILTVNPEYKEDEATNCQYIRLWYRWDGKDGAVLLDVEDLPQEEAIMTIKSNDELLNQARELIGEDQLEFLNFIEANQENLSRQDNTILVKDYIDILDKNLETENTKLKSLLKINSYDDDLEKLKTRYSISIDLINDMEFLKRQKVLSSEEDLKELFIGSLEKGYKINTRESKYRIVINYKFFFNIFKDNLLNEYRDYLRILSAYSDNQLADLSLDELAERIVLIENFNLTYPYSDNISELKNYHDEYVDIFFNIKEEDIDISKEKEDEKKIVSNIRDKYKEIKERYSHSYFSDLISKYLSKNNS